MMLIPIAIDSNALLEISVAHTLYQSNKASRPSTNGQNTSLVVKVGKSFVSTLTYYILFQVDRNL